VNAARLRKILLQDWGLKLISLGFATLLWLFVVGEKRSEVSLSIPLELTGISDEIVIVSRVPDSIRVRLNGPRTLLAGVNTRTLSVALNLQGIQPGISSLEILPSRLDVPRGVEVTYISPSVITLEADLKDQRSVRLKPRIRGTPADGLEVSEVKVSPSEIDVEGPERILKQLREIQTEVVDVTGLEGSVTRPVELALPDPNIRATLKRPIRLDIVIQETRAEREFVEVPVEPPGPEWRVAPATVDIKVEGGLRAVSRLKAKDLTVTVRPPGNELPKEPVRVTVTGPPGVKLLSVKPERVEVALPAQKQAPSAGPAIPAGAPKSNGG